MASRRGSARDGRKTAFKESFSFEAFQSIFSKVVRDLNGSIITGEEDGGRYKKMVTVSLPEAARPVRVSLQHVHRTLGCGEPATEERCAEAVKSLLKELAAGEKLPSVSDVTNNLILTVKTRNFTENFVSNGEFHFTRNFHVNAEEWPSSSNVESETSGASTADSASKEEEQLVVQSFSCRSGALVKALVQNMADHDLWITDRLLQRFGLSETRAFELAVTNLEKATPSPLESHFAILGVRRDLEAIKQRLKQRKHDICFVKTYKWGPVFVWARFEDQRTLSRLILPRFIECLAGAFGCGPTSLVIIPFSNYELYAGNCESKESMWFLAEQVALDKNQAVIAHPGAIHVSTRPYKVIVYRHLQTARGRLEPQSVVTKLRNDQGLVELEPYPVWGGTLGLQIWEGPVRKCLYPVPRTRDELESLDPYKAEDRGSVCEVVEESLCFADVCWNITRRQATNKILVDTQEITSKAELCKKKPEDAKLLKCGKCGDVRYCSKECQTLSWRKDHKTECDARKQAGQGSQAVKTGRKKKAAQKALKDHEKEVRERLAQTIAENFRDVHS